MKKLFFFGALLPMLCLGACGGGQHLSGGLAWAKRV